MSDENQRKRNVDHIAKNSKIMASVLAHEVVTKVYVADIEAIKEKNLRDQKRIQITVRDAKGRAKNMIFSEEFNKKNRPIVGGVLTMGLAANGAIIYHDRIEEGLE
mgnify:CR=1 FL=1